MSYLSYLSADSLHGVLIRKTFCYNESCEIQQMLTMYTTTGIKQSCVWRLCPDQIETVWTAKNYGSMCSWAKPCLICIMQTRRTNICKNVMQIHHQQHYCMVASSSNPCQQLSSPVQLSVQARQRTDRFTATEDLSQLSRMLLATFSSGHIAPLASIITNTPVSLQRLMIIITIITIYCMCSWTRFRSS